MDDLDRLLESELKDQEFKEEWDKLELRYVVIRQLIKIRNTYNLSQAQLAKRLDTTQSVISRIENGTVNVGIDFIDNLARAFNKKVELKLI